MKTPAVKPKKAPLGIRLASWYIRRHIPPMPIDWLDEMTGRSMIGWMGFVQERIQARSHRSPDPNHDATNVEAWLRDLIRAVQQRRQPGYYDGNMRAASVLGFILVTWYLQTSKAKAFDPVRPIESRRAALQFRKQFIAWLLEQAVLDDAAGPLLFKGQSWDHPFADDAVDGTFV